MVVGAAVFAPSYMDAQPWRFEVDASELRLVLDPARTLPLDDPDQRFAQMSLGAALENGHAETAELLRSRGAKE